MITRWQNILYLKIFLKNPFLFLRSSLKIKIVCLLKHEHKIDTSMILTVSMVIFIPRKICRIDLNILVYGCFLIYLTENSYIIFQSKSIDIIQEHIWDNIYYWMYMSGSTPRWKKLCSGYQNYPLKGLNLRYMYHWKLSIWAEDSGAHIDMFWFYIIFGFKIRYMYRKIMAFL